MGDGSIELLMAEARRILREDHARVSPEVCRLHAEMALASGDAATGLREHLDIMISRQAALDERLQVTGETGIE